jgi:hypothetical protein
MDWVPQILLSFWPTPVFRPPFQSKWNAMSLPYQIAYVLGLRHLSFRACVTTLNGVVSRASYALEPDVFLGWPASELVAVHSARGFWLRGQKLPVTSEDDESPDFRLGAMAGAFSGFKGDDAKIGVAYTASAPRELLSHAFIVDLSCFWGIRGCDSVRQVVPLLWADRLRIANAAVARLRSGNPCPDRILDGRVRTLPDLNVALLEVVDSQPEKIGTGYRLKEVIRGRPEAFDVTAMHPGWSVASPNGAVPNPVSPVYPKRGERFLFFSGARFDSCRIVPATPSAESAVRKAIPATRQPQDQVGQARS